MKLREILCVLTLIDVDINTRRIVTTALSEPSRTFKMPSNNFCAVDTPFLTVTGLRSAIHCSTKCSQTTNVIQSCRYFNYWSSTTVSTAKCELFLYRPTNYDVIANCRFYGIHDNLQLNMPMVKTSSTTSLSSSSSQVTTGSQQHTTQFSVTTAATSASSQSTAPCSVNNWLLLHSRVDSSYPVNLYWNNYVQGFGSLSSCSNFWLGLERMHQLTTAPGTVYTLRFEIQAIADGGWYSAEYAWFYIDSAATSYTLRASSTVKAGSAGDPINDPSYNTNGSPFSARDVDNDGCPSYQCAQSWQGGWWFSCCGRFNLNGADTMYQWQPLVQIIYSTGLKASRMLVMNVI